ncbi:MAG: hypothetical protein JWN40_5255 [Phycisphaerales bacterium]|nr:hypothetical protein [Phycisphaerales bacterium]
MMAKMFYTLDETKGALGLNEEEIKQLSREGRLREFRDGPRLMFKADQVDNLKAELAGGGGDQISLGPSDSGVGLSLADSKASPLSGSGISLADTDFGKSPGAGMVKDDTALAADLGLSGTAAGIPSPGRAGDTRSGSKVGSRVGVNVFGDEDSGRVDPMAQTSIGSGIQDQINLEGVGSGSGLLDLTRESDDTSLGAELLDEISPGGSGAGGGGGGARRGTMVAADSGMAMETPRSSGRSVISQPVYVEAPDALAPALGWLAIFGAGVVIFGLFVLLNAVMGVRPAMIAGMSGPTGKGMVYLLMALGGAALFFVIGLIIGKMGAGTTKR